MFLKRNRFIGMLLISTGLILMTPTGAKASKRIVNVRGNHQQTFFLTLKGQNNSQLTNFIYQTVTPGSANFHKYLTPNSFGRKYGLSSANVKVVGNYFRKYHLKATPYAGNVLMKISGKTKNINRALKIKLKQSNYKKGTNYQVPNRHYQLPKKVAKNIEYVLELSKTFDGKNATTTGASAQSKTKKWTFKSKDPNIQDRTTNKFVRNYNASSLYQNHALGQNQTIGIITLSNYRQSDVQHYFNLEHLNYDASRFHKIMVNKPKLSGDNAFYGPFESSMDVEQASALAPKAQINAYIGDDFVTDYATAISSNQASVLSLSWGMYEQSLTKNNFYKGYYQTIDRLMKQAAAQGITSFACSGDNGAYAFAFGSNNKGLFFPSTSQFVTSVGGTTLPFKNVPYSDVMESNVQNDKLATLSKEHSWTYSLLYQLYGNSYVNQQSSKANAKYTEAINSLRIGNKKLTAKEKRAIFQEQLKNVQASGGGFSRVEPLPEYQRGVSGVGRYNAKDILNLKKMEIDVTAPVFSGYTKGRNVPDISGNADPLTGYDVYALGNLVSSGGGTSVVTPQMAAMAAVINSAQGQRTGFWNPQIYRFAKTSESPFTPLNSTDDDNMFYTGQPGKIYNQATGLGTVNFTKLNQAFSNQK